MSLASAPKAMKNTLLIMFETRSGTIVRVSSVATKKVCPEQGTYIGNGDVGEEDFQKTIEHRVERNVVRIETELYENFCDPEIVLLPCR